MKSQEYCGRYALSMTTIDCIFYPKTLIFTDCWRKMHSCGEVCDTKGVDVQVPYPNSKISV